MNQSRDRVGQDLSSRITVIGIHPRVKRIVNSNFIKNSNLKMKNFQTLFFICQNSKPELEHLLKGSAAISCDESF